MKTICPPGYHRNSFVATHALGQMCISCHKAIVLITERAHCFHDYIYITPVSSNSLKQMCHPDTPSRPSVRAINSRISLKQSTANLRLHFREVA